MVALVPVGFFGLSSTLVVWWSVQCESCAWENPAAAWWAQGVWLAGVALWLLTLVVALAR